ncbi:MAG: sulfite exporter TauE/SafE family protein [Vitreoscilla sp.]
MEAFALGALVGLLLALTGAGGGILAVPLLVFALHLGLAEAAPIGLLAVGLAAAMSAALGLRDGIVRYRAAGLMGGLAMALAPAGVAAAQRVPNAPLTLAFAAVLGLSAWRMWQRARHALRAGACDAPERAALPCVLDARDGRLVWTRPCAQALAVTGVTAGLLSGLLGVGGGFVIVPALTRFTELSARSIVATSLAVIALASIGGVGAAAWHGAIAWDIALPFAIGSVFATLAARVIAARVAGPRLQQGFAIVSAAVGVLLVMRGLGALATR